MPMSKKQQAPTKSSAPRMAEAGMMTCAFVIRKKHRLALEARAARNERTMSAELRRILDAALEAERAE